MIKFVVICLVFGTICCHGAAQETVVAGASGVYVEVYNEDALKWENLGSFPDRYRTFPNGDPNPEPGLWGSALNEIVFSTFEGVFYSIFAVSPSITDIGDIEITGDGIVFVGRHVSVPPVLNRNFILDAAGCNDLNSLTTSGSKAVVKANLKGDILGDFMAYDIASFKCDTIRGDVVHNSSDDSSSPDSGRVVCDSVASTGSYTSNGVRLSSMFVESAVSGTIQTTGNAVIHNLNIGSLNGGAIVSASDLNLLTIRGDAYGKLDVGNIITTIDITGSWGSDGNGYRLLEIINADSIGTLGVSGDFVGDLADINLDRFFVDGNIYDYDTILAQVTTSDITTSSNIKRFAAVGWPPSPLGQDESLLNLTAPTVGAFFVGNRLKEGLINLTNGVGEFFVNKGGLTVPAEFRLGEGLGSEAYLHFGYDIADPQRQGLESKWAYLNHGIAGDSWDGEVSVGLSPSDPNRLILTENYTTLSDSIGGGAFGNSPFNFHQREEAPPAGENRDCNPYQLEVVDVGRSEELRSVVISHYGPVYVVTENTDPIVLCDEIDTGPHFRVEFLPWMDVNPVWVDRSSLFEVDLCETSYDDPITLSRTVRLVAKDDNAKGFKAAGTWRIRPLAGRVKSGGYYNPDVEYQSSVVSGDLGTPGSHSWYQFDVRLVLQPGVFALDSGNGVQASDLSQWIDTPYETNADGVTDSQDFIDMAEQYTGN